MTINETKILDDVKGPLTEVYILEFPHLEKEIRSFENKPKCSTCRHGFINGFYATENYEEKVKLIYGVGVEVDLRKPVAKQPNAIKPNGERKHIPNILKPSVYRISLDEYDEWFEEFISRNQMIKIYNTFYIPEEKIVVVSTQGRIRQ
jgi:hypothetical protein